MSKPKLVRFPPKGQEGTYYDAIVAKLAETQYIVRSTSYENSCNWENWSHQSWLRPEDIKVPLTWVQDCAGAIIKVGTFGGEDVTIICFWNVLNGNRVMHFETLGQVSHHQLIEDWFDRHCNPYTPDGRMARTDAQNFHLVAHYCQQYPDNKKTVQKNKK